MGVPRIGQHRRADGGDAPKRDRAPRPTRHGLNATLARVNLRGFRALDRRTVAARGAIEFRTSLVQDLGGLEALSAQRLALVEAAARTWLYLQHLDCWLLEQKSLVNAKRKAALPIVRDRQAMAESLSRLLGQLGLDRVQAPAKDLAQVIAEIEASKREKAAEVGRKVLTGAVAGVGSDPDRQAHATVASHVAPRGDLGQRAAPDTTAPRVRPAVAQPAEAVGLESGTPAPVVTPSSLRPPESAYPSSPEMEF